MITPSTEKFTGSRDEYLDLLETKYFTVCKDKTVLEIGAMNGYHSELIVKNKPKNFDVIEGNQSLAQHDLKKVSGIDNIIVDDAIMTLSSPTQPYDVVVCFGVLYHLHSPIHLLELIVNHCKPQYILLDSVGPFDGGMPDSSPFHDEHVNDLGTRQVRENFKFSGLKIMCPGSIIQLVMSRLGYNLVKSSDLNVDNFISKSNSWVALWQKQGVTQ